MEKTKQELERRLKAQKESGWFIFFIMCLCFLGLLILSHQLEHKEKELQICQDENDIIFSQLHSYEYKDWRLKYDLTNYTCPNNYRVDSVFDNQYWCCKKDYSDCLAIFRVTNKEVQNR